MNSSILNVVIVYVTVLIHTQFPIINLEFTQTFLTHPHQIIQDCAIKLNQAPSKFCSFYSNFRECQTVYTSCSESLFPQFPMTFDSNQIHMCNMTPIPAVNDQAALLEKLLDNLSIMRPSYEDP